MIHSDSHPMDAYFAADGILSKGREYRAGQHKMARCVYDSLFERRPLLVEAPTGVGKTLAYLVPGICWVEAGPLQKEDRRIAIVVLANALLDQIAADLPGILAAMGSSVTFGVLKGRPQYICDDRMARATDVIARPSYKQTLTDAEVRQLQSVLEWYQGAADSNDVDAAGSVDSAPEHSENVRKLITIESGGCKSARNRQNGACEADADKTCAFLNARAAAVSAQIVLTNIDLFMANHRLGGRIFGNVNVVFVDEAHLLHDKVRDSFQERFSPAIYGRVAKQLKELAKPLSHAAGEKLPPEKDGTFVECVGVDLTDRADDLFKLMRGYAKKRVSPRPDGEGNPSEDLIEVLIESDPESEAFDAATQALLDEASNVPMLAKAMGLDPDDEEYAELFDVGKKTETLQRTLRRERKGWAHWIEVEPKSQRVAVCAMPVRVSETIRGIFHADCEGNERPVIAVSATLQTGGSFAYAGRQLGMPHDGKRLVAQTLVVEGSFDMPGRAAMYKLPSVRTTGSSGKARSQYNAEVSADVRELVVETEGRALVLPTAKRDMDAAVRCVSGLGHTVLVQGQTPKGEIVRVFKEDVHSILVGLKTYGTGFDVPGEALEAVIVWRLPFPKQTPIDEWMRRHEDEGSWFGAEYMPRMLFDLRQQLGRLMRRKNDRGILVIADSRWHTGAMARTIQKSLPQGLRTLTSLAEVRSFLASVPR